MSFEIKTKRRKAMKNLKTALKTFGIEKAQARYLNADRIAVYVDGAYYGIWDCEKNTFVD